MNRASKVTLGSMAVIVLLLVAGCPKPWSLTLVNNSGRDLGIRLTGAVIPWTNQGSVHFERELGQMKWVPSTRSKGTVPLLQVVSRGEVREYKLDIFPLPAELDAPGGSKSYIFQLEPDENLYAVNPQAKELPASIGVQPGHLPIKPGL